jgi:hypothetical protein
MSQYFTYNDFQGRLPIDSLTAQPSCKSCSKPTCYNTYKNVQGVSRSKHEYTAAFALQPKDTKPVDGYVCDISMVGCVGSDIENSDPYNINIKTVSKCNPTNPSFYNIDLPYVDGSYDRNKKESSRYSSSRSYNNYSRTAANSDIPSGQYPNYTLNIDQKKYLTAKEISKRTSSQINKIVKQIIKDKSSLSPKQSVSVPKKSKQIASTTSSKRVPIVVPVSANKVKKITNEFDFDSFVKELNL